MVRRSPRNCAAQKNTCNETDSSMEARTQYANANGGDTLQYRVCFIRTVDLTNVMLRQNAL